MAIASVGTLEINSAYTPEAPFATHTVLSTGPITIGVAVPENTIPPGAGVVAGSYSTQLDIKTTWPNGYLKFGALSFEPTGTGSVALNRGTSASGSFTPTIPQASVSLNCYWPFKVLGTFTVNSGTLVVTLTNDGSDSNAAVVADTIWINPEASPGTVTTIGYGQAGFSSTGTWTVRTGGYKFQGFETSAPWQGASTATWTFTGLAAGNYRVAAFWPRIAYSVLDATYKIYDNTTLLASVGPLVQHEMPTPDIKSEATVYTATLPGSVSSDPWLSGPIVREWRHIVVPSTSGNVDHPFMRIAFNTRCYASGGSRVDISIENVLDKTSSTMAFYDISINVDNVTVFTQNAINQGWMTRWRKKFNVSLTEGTIDLDWTPAHKANIFPEFLDTINNNVEGTNADFDFTPLARGSVIYDRMGNVGGRPDLSWYPDWSARYVVYGGEDRRDFILKAGDYSGSWQIHYLKADGTRQTIDAEPRFYLNKAAAQVGLVGAVGDWEGIGVLEPDYAHQPSLAYQPYLITVDRYYAEEITYWADFDLLATFSSDQYAAREGSLGLIQGSETRATAWCLREMADAAAILPDADPAKAYFKEKVNNNLQWLETWAVDNRIASGAAFLIYRNDYHDPGRTKLWVSLFEYFLLSWSLDNCYLKKVGTMTGMRDVICYFFTSICSDLTIRDWAVNFSLAVGEPTDPPTTYYRTVQECVAKTQEDFPPLDLPAGYSNYGPLIRATLQAAVSFGVPNAASALSYVESQCLTTLNNTVPGFAIKRTFI